MNNGIAVCLVIIGLVAAVVCLQLPDAEVKTPTPITAPDLNYSQPRDETPFLRAEVKRLKVELAQSRDREQRLQNYYEQRIIDLEYDLQRLIDEQQRRIDQGL